jgi:hypothetical protein
LVRCGVIGYGLFGAHHARAFAAAPGAELVAIAVPSEASRAAAIAAHAGAAVHTDYHQLLERADIDAVSFVVPNGLCGKQLKSGRKSGILGAATCPRLLARSFTMPKATMPPPPVSCVHEIGETAGKVWKTLNQHGSQSVAKLVERVGGNRDVAMQAMGWLAREGKLEISETKRGKVVALKEE